MSEDAETKAYAEGRKDQHEDDLKALYQRLQTMKSDKEAELQRIQDELTSVTNELRIIVEGEYLSPPFI